MAQPGAVRRDACHCSRAHAACALYRVFVAARRQGVTQRRGPVAPATVVLLWAVLAAAGVVAVVALARQDWRPVLDLAMTELRLRDVGTRDTPLTGVYARFGVGARRASHPGPLGLWAMFPVYRLFGATGWAMSVASVFLHLAASSAALWVARRRGGIRLVLAVAVMLALLLHAAGWQILSDGWNPHIAFLWWVVFLLGIWSLTLGDHAMLPISVVAGSFCLANHIGYLGLVVALLGAGLVALAVLDGRRRDAVQRRALVRWGAWSAALAVALWLPALLEELLGERGNLSRLVEGISNQTSDPIGLRRGAEALLVALSPWRLVTGDLRDPSPIVTGSWVPGALLVLGLALATAVTWQRAARSLLRLQGVLWVTLAVALVSATQIAGPVWYWLLLWAHGIAAVALLAIAWAVHCRMPTSPMPGRFPAGAQVVATGVVLVVLVAWLTYDAATAEVPNREQSDLLGALVPSTAAAIDPDGRYLVTWRDPIELGVAGYGLLNELERRGFRVGAERAFSVEVTPRQVIHPDGATAEIRLARGVAVEDLRRAPGVRQVAYVAPDPAEWEEFKRLRADVIDQLAAGGHDDVVAGVDRDLLSTLFNAQEIPASARRQMERMLGLDVPSAVFIGHPSALPDE